MSLLDRFNLKILEELSHNGRIPVSQLAKLIGISKSPCQTRVKKLEQEGYIKGYKAILDHSKMGQEHVAFAQLRLSDTRADALEAFNDAVRTVPEVEECHMIASSFDYLVKIRTSDINTYRKVLGESLSSLPHVASTSTFVSMQAVKEQ